MRASAGRYLPRSVSSSCTPDGLFGRARLIGQPGTGVAEQMGRALGKNGDAGMSEVG